MYIGELFKISKYKLLITIIISIIVINSTYCNQSYPPPGFCSVSHSFSFPFLSILMLPFLSILEIFPNFKYIEIAWLYIWSFLYAYVLSCIIVIVYDRFRKFADKYYSGSK
jgi:hypothetical protein